MDWHRELCGYIIKKGFASGHFHGDQSAALSEEDRVKSALSFIFQNPGVTALVIGTINPEHLKSNVAQLSALLETPPSSDLA